MSIERASFFKKTIKFEIARINQSKLCMVKFWQIYERIKVKKKRQSSKSTIRFMQLFLKSYLILIDIQICWFDNWHNLPNIRKSVWDICWQNAETTNFFPIPYNFWKGMCCKYISLHRNAPYTLLFGPVYFRKKDIPNEL